MHSNLMPRRWPLFYLNLLTRHTITLWKTSIPFVHFNITGLEKSCQAHPKSSRETSAKVWRVRSSTGIAYTDLLTLCFPVTKVINFFIFIDFWKPQWTNQCLHELKTIAVLCSSPVVKVAMTPLVPHVSAYILCIGLNSSMKNRRISHDS